VGIVFLAMGEGAALSVVPGIGGEGGGKCAGCGRSAAVIRYGQDHWDAERIDAEITQVAEWARQRGVPVVCNEFGVYRAYADPHDREAWIHDVRTALERHGMGWTMWDYSGSFGVVTKKDGRSMPDEITLRALGLTAAEKLTEEQKDRLRR